MEHKNKELDFLCSHARTILYDKHPFVTKNKAWSFYCLNCLQKFNSNNEEMTHFYLWNYPEFGDPVSEKNHLYLCSAGCVNQMVEKKGMDIKAWNEELNASMEKFQKNEEQKKQKEIRAKEDAFMKSFSQKRR